MFQVITEFQTSVKVCISFFNFALTLFMVMTDKYLNSEKF